MGDKWKREMGKEGWKPCLKGQRGLSALPSWARLRLNLIWGSRDWLQPLQVITKSSCKVFFLSPWKAPRMGIIIKEGNFKKEIAHPIPNPTFLQQDSFLGTSELFQPLPCSFQKSRRKSCPFQRCFISFSCEKIPIKIRNWGLSAFLARISESRAPPALRTPWIWSCAKGHQTLRALINDKLMITLSIPEDFTSPRQSTRRKMSKWSENKTARGEEPTCFFFFFFLCILGIFGAHCL